MAYLMEGFSGMVDKLLWRNDDDVYDRMSHRWTPALLAGFAVLVTSYQNLDNPIHCWVPVHFTGGWAAYTNQWCWIKNTYWLHFDEEIPKEVQHREKHPIIYYQWVPLILMVQALMFYLPVLLWRNLNSRTGIDLNDIVETAEKFQFSDDMETKKKTLNFLSKQTDRYLGMSKRPTNKFGGPFSNLGPVMKNCLSTLCTPCCGKRFGNYISMMYLFVKLLMLANVIGQIFLLNKFLGFDYNLYGFYVVRAWMNGSEWHESPRFPRVTLCDFDIRRLGNIHRYTVQCVLTINLFNEMIYLVIWFWLCFVALLTAVGILLLLLRIFISTDKFSYIEKHLVLDNVYNPDKEKDRILMRKFVDEYLRQDGVLMLRLVGHNTNKVVVNEFICSLFKFYTEKKDVRKDVHDKLTDSDEDEL
jgi:hypothetical protein